MFVQFLYFVFTKVQLLCCICCIVYVVHNVGIKIGKKFKKEEDAFMMAINQVSMTNIIRVIIFSIYNFLHNVRLICLLCLTYIYVTVTMFNFYFYLSSVINLLGHF